MELLEVRLFIFLALGLVVIIIGSILSMIINNPERIVRPAIAILILMFVISMAMPINIHF